MKRLDKSGYAVDREVFLCRVEKFEDADTDIAAAITELKELVIDQVLHEHRYA